MNSPGESPPEELTTENIGFDFRDDPCHHCVTYGAGKICRKQVGMPCVGQCPICKHAPGTIEIKTYDEGETTIWLRKGVCRECQHEHGLSSIAPLIT